MACPKTPGIDGVASANLRGRPFRSTVWMLSSSGDAGRPPPLPFARGVVGGDMSPGVWGGRSYRHGRSAADPLAPNEPNSFRGCKSCCCAAP